MILTIFQLSAFSLVEAVELKVQIERVKSMFGLHTRLEGEFGLKAAIYRVKNVACYLSVFSLRHFWLIDGEPYVTWTER